MFGASGLYPRSDAGRQQRRRSWVACDVVRHAQRAAQHRIVEVFAHHHRRVAADHRSRGNAEGQEGARQYGCAVTDVERTGNDAVGAYPDIVADDWPALSTVGHCVSEGAAIVNRRTCADAARAAKQVSPVRQVRSAADLAVRSELGPAEQNVEAAADALEQPREPPERTAYLSSTQAIVADAMEG